jgi:hypothetical protein
MLNTALSDSWSFFKTHLVALSLLILPIVVPLEIITSVYHSLYTGDEFIMADELFPMGLYFAVYPIFSIAVVFYLAGAINNEFQSTKTLWKLGLQYWLPFNVLNLLIGVMIVSGFIVFIIPGVILAIRYLFAQFELLLNNARPLPAMKTSWEKTGKYFWILLNGYAIITVALYLPLYSLLSALDQTTTFYMIINAIANIIYSVLSVFYTIFSYRIYEFSREPQTIT